jgi:hypothetical protein
LENGFVKRTHVLESEFGSMTNSLDAGVCILCLSNDHTFPLTNILCFVMQLRHLYPIDSITVAGHINSLQKVLDSYADDILSFLSQRKKNALQMSAQFDMLTQHNHPSSQGEEEGKVNDEDTAPSANANVSNPSSPGVASRPSHHSKDDSSSDSDPIRGTSDVYKRRKAKANVDVFPFDFEHKGQLGSDDIPDGDKKPAAKPDETDSDDIPDGDKKPAAKPDETDRDGDSNCQHRLSGRQRQSQRKNLATQLPIPNCENASFNVPCLPHTHTDCSTLLTSQCMKTTSSLTTFASMLTHPVNLLRIGPNGVSST